MKYQAIFGEHENVEKNQGNAEQHLMRTKKI